MASQAAGAILPPATNYTPDLFCPSCGYSLRGICSDRCPECGLEIDRAELAESQIPWSHRGKIGRARAYWRTVWFCTFRRRRLADQIARPLSHSDAQRFRFVTIAVIAGPLLLALPFIPSAAGSGMCEGLLLPESLARWTIPLMLIGFVLSLLAITGVPSYFFHPASLPVPQQDRGIALSYYLCAPLAPAALLAYVWVGLLLAAPLIPDPVFKPHATFIMASLSVPPCAAFILVLYFFFNAAGVLRRGLRVGAGRAALMIAAMIVSVTVVGPALVFGIPWIVAYVYWLAWG